MAESGYNELLDELIDIRKDFQALQNPLGNLVGALTAEPQEEPTFNPADYKDKPRANTVTCVTCQSRDAGACARCISVCPANAISIDEGSIEISDACTKCGLCVPVCPTESFSTPRYNAKKLYDSILEVAVAHEQCYVTCTRAIGRTGRLPESNEVILPCVGLVPKEVWFSLLVEAPNISVYLPFGICDKCRASAGEELYGNAIATAEEWAGRGVGLEVAEEALVRGKKRAWERREFMNSVARGAQGLLGPAGRAVTSVQAVAARLDAHRKQIDRLTNQLARTQGTSAGNRRRLMLQRQSLLLGALQEVPSLASKVEVRLPVCDSGLCTLCDECAKACPTHAVDLDNSGRFSVEATYCVGCGHCAYVCPEHALSMEPFDAYDLVVVDEDSGMSREEQQQRKDELNALRDRAMGRLTQVANALEKLDDDADADIDA